MRTRAVLALGSNLGDRDANLSRGLEQIAARVGRITARSRRMRTEPLVHPDTPTLGQGDYLNMVVVVETELEPIALLDACQEIEAAVGRDRAAEVGRWQARLLDVDIVAVDDRVVHADRLDVPHAQMASRRFVLEPMLEVWPDWTHPELGSDVATLLDRVAQREVHEGHMDDLIAMTHQSFTRPHPRPMGSLVVRDGERLGAGVSRVNVDHDPTAHAEIVAIRAACAALGHPDLDGAVLYATAEPCPMCLAAIYYAGIRDVFYGISCEEARGFGVADAALYRELARPRDGRRVSLHRIRGGEVRHLFERFRSENTGYRSRLFRKRLVPEDDG